MGQKAEAVRAVLRPSGEPRALIDTLGVSDGRRVAGAERSTRRRARHYHPSRRAEHTRAVSQRRSSSTSEPERCLESMPMRLRSCSPSRWPASSPRAAASDRDAVQNVASTDARRRAGRPGHTLRPRTTPESEASRGPASSPTGIAFASPFDHAGHPSKAGPGVWAVRPGWVRGGYQAATGGPWA